MWHHQGWGKYWTYEYEYWKISTRVVPEYNVFSIFMFTILGKTSTWVVLAPALGTMCISDQHSVSLQFSQYFSVYIYFMICRSRDISETQQHGFSFDNWHIIYCHYMSLCHCDHDMKSHKKNAPSHEQIIFSRLLRKQFVVVPVFLPAYSRNTCIFCMQRYIKWLCWIGHDCAMTDFLLRC